ncbi:MAG: phosphatase PAP2 family protein [Bacteroidales bacterium]|jgi:undecaprenyl-diphosphatase|nr:phosphatase PAP2 family protein [Bacteroidales bacterium]
MNWFQKILEIDTRLFLYLNNFHNDLWDTIMLMVTCKETWLPFYIIIIFFLIKNYRSKSVSILFFLALTILLSDQLSVLIKESVGRLRPVYNPEIEHIVHNVLRKGGKFGFVSSHAANSFGIFIFTSLIFKNRNYYILLLFWAILFSYSRIYSGVHYPSDIICGAFLGVLTGISTYKIMMFVENHYFIARLPRIEKTRLETVQSTIILLGFGVLILTTFIVVYTLHYYNYL